VRDQTKSGSRGAERRRFDDVLFGEAAHTTLAVKAAIVGVVAAVAVIDLASGPFVRFPIAFVLPVLITASRSRFWGYLLAAASPVPRLLFRSVWEVPWPWSATVANAAVQIGVLVALAWLVRRVVEQRRLIARLRELTTICAYCKKVRTPEGSWEQIESFVARRDLVDFSHTYCPACLRQHHPEQADLVEAEEAAAADRARLA